MTEAPSVFARMRAGLASMLAGIGAGFHWFEDRTARGMRPWLLGLVALAIAAVVLVGVFHERHEAAHWFGGRDVERHAGPRALGPDPAGKPEAKSHGGPAARPEAPVP